MIVLEIIVAVLCALVLIGAVVFLAVLCLLAFGAKDLDDLFNDNVNDDFNPNDYNPF